MFRRTEYRLFLDSIVLLTPFYVRSPASPTLVKKLLCTCLLCVKPTTSYLYTLTRLNLFVLYINISMRELSIHILTCSGDVLLKTGKTITNGEIETPWIIAQFCVTAQKVTNIAMIFHLKSGRKFVYTLFQNFGIHSQGIGSTVPTARASIGTQTPNQNTYVRTAINSQNEKAYIHNLLKLYLCVCLTLI